MLLLFFLPLLLLAIYFQVQYNRLWRDSFRAHLQVLAEQQAATFDLFLRERITNVANVANDPRLSITTLSNESLEPFFQELRSTSEAFVDLGVVNSEGILDAYVGPIDFQLPIDYSDESWFNDVSSNSSRSVITDVYLGFRNRPHFTIAVRPTRGLDGRVVRATLSPERLAEYLTTLEGASEVHAGLVNAGGSLQLLTPHAEESLPDSFPPPPTSPARGFVSFDSQDGESDFAYAWLSETRWALVVTSATHDHEVTAGAYPRPSTILPLTLAILALVGATIPLRARTLTKRQIAVEEHEAELSGQLAHAAKLASVGALAAGVAHEINNPLAIIAEEAGLLKDSFDPNLPPDEEPVDVVQHVGIIQDAVFRCRDITRKLLSFVRHDPIRLEKQHIHEVLDEVLDGMLANELAISNVDVIRSYDSSVESMVTDRNQLVQVFVNFVKNAVDAMPSGGELRIATVHGEEEMSVIVSDTGFGMSEDQVKKVFLPFYTTKDPGKGTGLGLSVSCSIIENFGGSVFVESELGKGTVFTIKLPYGIS